MEYIHEVAKSQTRLSDFHFHFSYVLLDLYLFYLGVNVNDDMGFFVLFFFNFLSHCTACGTLVPRSEIELTPSTVEVGSLNPRTTGKFLTLFFISNSKCSLVEYRK